MNKKLTLGLTTLSAALLLAACNDGGQYEKLVKKADKAMESLNVEDAISIYEEILTLDPTKIEYGYSRLSLINEKLDAAYEFQDEIEHLESIAENAKSSAEALEYNLESVYEITEVQYTLNNALELLSNFPSTQMYKDLYALSQTVTEKTDKKLIAPLIEEIEGNIKAVDYESAENNIELLFELQHAFNSLIALEDVEKYQKTVEDEKARYAVQPRKYNKRDIVLYEDSNAGKMTFLGEGYNNDSLRAYFKVEGGLEQLMKRDGIGLSTQFIFDSGDYDKSSSFSVTYYKGYAILSTPIEIGDSEEIVRFDYDLNFLGLEEMKTVSLTSVSEEGTIPAILYLANEKTVETDLKAETEDYKLHFTSMIIDGNYVKLQGKLNAKKDLPGEYTPKGYFVAPEKYIYSSARLNEDTFFAGIETNVEMEFEFDRTEILSDETTFGIISIADTQFIVDLTTGKEVTKKSFPLIDLISYKKEDANFTHDESNLEDGELIADKAGKKYTNYYSMKTYSSWFSSTDEQPYIYYNLKQKFATLKVDVAVASHTADPAYGSSVVSFIADGNVLKTITLNADSATETIELNISNVNKFEIKIEQTKGNDGFQEVIFGNGVVTSK